MTTTMRALVLGGAVLLRLVTAAHSWAGVTVAVSPTSVTAGGEVTVSAQATFVAAPDSASTRCPLSVSFGDGSAPAAESCATTPCTLTVRHAYRDPGSYQVRAETAVCRAASGAVLTTDPLAAEALVSVAAALPPATLTLSADPAIVRAPRETGATAAVQYRVVSSRAVRVALSSPSGRFEAGGETLGTVASPLALALSGEGGTAAETIRFTPEVLRAAFNRGARSVTWVRDFSGGGYALRATVTALIISPAVEFDVERVELSFGNRRPEIVVKRGEAGLTAGAGLRFTGSGLLQVRWEVDGRVLVPPVSRHVNLGDAADLVSPELPTFDPGTHEVRLVITSPTPSFPLPTIVYLVRSSDAAPKALAIRLLTPAEGETLAYRPELFRWEAGPGAAVFLAQFYDAERDAPIFSAWTRANEYRLPELLYRDLFQAGGRYRWKVSAFNAEENLAGESRLAPFGFAQP